MDDSGTIRRFLAAGALALLLAAPAAAAQGRSVVVTTVGGTITPVVADHIRETIAFAIREGHQAVVVELDTPGGLDTSMREIIRSILSAPVPVVVHVAPSGARAASAGALITLSAHIAAMAPGTAIGAATPIDLQGGDVADKAVNDAAAYARSIAELRGRNADFAEQTVREARSVAADTALELDAIDLIASGRSELLDAIDGRTVTLASGTETTLRTRDADVVAFELSGFRRILQTIADPNLAFLFLSIGTLAIIYELANPGVGAGGIVGVILIALAMYSLSVLPVNVVGVGLLLLAAALFVAEVLTPGVGVFAAGGTVSLILGGLFLFRGSVRIDLVVLLPMAAVAGGAAAAFTTLAWRSRSAPVASSVVGKTAIVRTSGEVTVDGTWWRARTTGDPLEPGGRARVVGMEDLELIVEREEDGT